MSVKCFKVAQKNLQKPTDPVKHYLRNKATGEMTERDLVQKGASISLMNPVDIKAANEFFCNSFRKRYRMARLFALAILAPLC
jgi:hypothetical protein